MSEDWRPTTTHERLVRRAASLAEVRRFFAARGVLEVDTPVVVNHAATDVHIHCARVEFPALPTRPFYLHPSPEYAMKRLLAAGSGDIYQVCHVVRDFERGRQHNSEFTLIEWYRLGFSLEALMDEVDALVRVLLAMPTGMLHSERLTYREAFQRELGLDPLTASDETLAQAAAQVGFEPEMSGKVTRAQLLDALVAVAIGPRLGESALTFIHRYPADQAALARLDPDDSSVALRFELYCRGVELANGFHELGDPDEQRSRFIADNEARRAAGLPVHALDERLLEALRSGLPDCAGVALGFDRTLMLATEAASIDAVLPFPAERA